MVKQQKSQSYQRKLRKIKPIKRSRKAEIYYKKQLNKYVRLLNKITSESIRKYGLKGALDNLLASLVVNNQLDDLAKETAYKFVKMGEEIHSSEFVKYIKAHTGVDVTVTLATNKKLIEQMRIMTTANVQLIKSIGSQHFDKIQNAVSQGVLQGFSNEQISKEIQRISGATKSRAIFIARDQSAKLNGTLEELEQKELGIKKYRWHSSGDGRVRESHQAKDGEIFSWSKPPKDTGNPGQDYNCRCIAIPLFE